METAELFNTCQAKKICRTFDADCFLGHKLSCWNNNLLLGNTINGHNYVDLLVKLTEVVTIKREITRTHNLHLLQVNAASHSERSVQATANDLNIVILIHSPCSPDFVASDFFYIPKSLKKRLKEIIMIALKKLYGHMMSGFAWKIGCSISKVKQIWQKYVNSDDGYV